MTTTRENESVLWVGSDSFYEDFVAFALGVFRIFFYKLNKKKIDQNYCLKNFYKLNLTNE